MLLAIVDGPGPASADMVAHKVSWMIKSKKSVACLLKRAESNFPAADQILIPLALYSMVRPSTRLFKTLHDLPTTHSPSLPALTYSIGLSYASKNSPPFFPADADPPKCVEPNDVEPALTGQIRLRRSAEQDWTMGRGDVAASSGERGAE